ncbi:lipase family protein [Paenibacillaceae bacterium WGS1546]|uniref:lipase family protein n=1 Tax=Cohnella sp. WGS1546 TaxID=3366810 RepID=UPI00372D4224
MSGYDIRTAIFLAAVCSQTYAQFNDPDGRFVVPDGYSFVREIRARSLAGAPERFGFILQSDSHVVVAFRGSSTTTDWISDAIASQTKLKYVRNGGMTHRGFTNIYDSARSRILSALGKLSAGKALYITGHSLGGALATLCALDAAVNSPFRSPRTYTFGSPRVGDPDFAKAYAKHAGGTFRVHNRFDVVTHLPPHIYRLPKTGRKYYYEHVRQSEPLAYHDGSVSGNHVLGGYYAELARRDPIFAERLSAMNPGFCPTPADDPYDKASS